MEMLERCPGCSVTREIESSKAESQARGARACARCGYEGPFLRAPAPERQGRDSMPSFSGARARLKTATQDLFRLSGNHSLPAEAPPVVAPIVVSVKPAEEPSSSRKAEASIMFSLEELMKQNTTIATKREEAPAQLWNMESATPLFGTSHDQALLTTPMKVEPLSSVDSMTLPSHPPRVRRWLPFMAVAGVTVALAGAGFWKFGSPLHRDAVATVSPPAPVQGQAEQKPPAEVAPAQAPAPAEPPQALPTAVTAAVAEPPAIAPEPEPGATPVRKPEAPTKDRVTSKKPIVRAPSAPSPQVFPFNKGAAKEALNAAASQSSGCRQGGPPGKGKIQVTFGTNGKVSSATIVEGPLGGTAAGKCALRHFRAAKVPAFAGAPVTVAKSFKVD